jgi:cell division protein FtsN
MTLKHSPPYPYQRGLNRENGKTLGGVLIGLIIGALIAVGIIWFVKRSPPPFEDKTNRATTATTQTPSASVPAQTNPAPLPGKPGDKPSGDKPRFDFYKILPDNNPDTLPLAPSAPGLSSPSGQTAPTAPTAPTATANKPAEPLYLQAGAFSKQTEADALKAKIILLGLEASVQAGETESKGRLFRVHVGPFPSLEAMNSARNQLTTNAISANPVKPDKGKSPVHP